jgi:cation transporter-like permease
MKELRNNVVVQFAILVLAVTAGQVLAKYLLGLSPDNVVTKPLKALFGRI